MGKTSIEWTDASWNPIVGCTEVSPGCANCYAARLAATRLKNTPAYKGLAHCDPELQGTALHTRWTQEVRFLPERLEEPLHWRKPRRIFVCDMGDLFHESVPPVQIAQIFGAMALSQRHTFQVLTKRPARMLDFIKNSEAKENVNQLFRLRGAWPTCDVSFEWPLPNVWLGVSVENQHFADERIPLLLSTPAAVRFISAEPLLGPVDLNLIGKLGESRSAIGCTPCNWNQTNATTQSGPHTCFENKPKLDWLICGGESGTNARPMHPDWARSLRDQCQAAGVPFFFKQWGSWMPSDASPGMFQEKYTPVWGDGASDRTKLVSVRVGKKVAGRLLDGREWNEFPQVQA